MTNAYETKETDFGTQTSHPSFGTLRFTKIYGGPTSLFGSSIEHSNTVELEIFHADVTRGLHQDTYFGSKPILRAEMSYSQFAEAITSFGIRPSFSVNRMVIGIPVPFPKEVIL